MKIHFIAIGGSAMHNLAIALHQKGYQVSGSDDTIYDPSKSILEKYPIDEKYIGKEDRYWTIDRINENNKIYYDSELECNHYYTNNGATWKSI